MGSKPIIFLSYSHDDRFLAGQIKNRLVAMSLEVFMAHEDIQPSVEWQEEIFKQLKNCNVFIPLFSSNFTKSKWTDQETGIAFGFEKIIVPVSLDDTMPYGFIGKYQTLKCKNDIPETCKMIFQTIIRKPIGENLKNNLIESLGTSSDYITSNDLAKILVDCAPFTEQQINELVYWFLVNDQVSGATTFKKLILPYIEKNEAKINTILFELFDAFRKNGWEPTHRINAHEVLLLKILESRPALTEDALQQLINDEKERGSLSTYEAIQKVMEKLGLSIALINMWKPERKRSYINVDNLPNEDLTLEEKIRALLVVAGPQPITEISRRTGANITELESTLSKMKDSGIIFENIRENTRTYEIS